MRTKFSDKVTLDAAWNGINFGAPMRVLLEHEGHIVVHVPGHHSWAGLYQPWRYHPAQLTVLNPVCERGMLPWKDIIEGRISKAKLLAIADDLAKLLDISLANARRVAEDVYTAYRKHMTATVSEKDTTP